MWTHFEESSMLGVSHCGRSMLREKKGRGIFWSIVTIILWGVTGFLLYKVFNEYFEYPVLTTVTVESQQDGVDFPTVVVCNHNPVKCREVFKISLKRPDVWKASGCRVGVQIEDYVKKVILEYNIRKGFQIPRAFTDPAADGSELLVDYWAHLYMDSKEIVDMLFYTETENILIGLQAFLQGEFQELRRSWDEKMEIENLYALEHLRLAISGRKLRVEILPTIIAAKDAGSSLTALAVRSIFSAAYFDTFRGDNLTDGETQSDLREAWMHAMVNGTMWDLNSSHSIQLLNISMGFLRFLLEEVIPVYEDYPSLLWMYGDPKTASESMNSLITNMISAIASATPLTQNDATAVNTTSSMSTASIPDQPPTASDWNMIAFAEKLTHLSLAENVMNKGNTFWDLALNSMNDVNEILITSINDFMQKCTYQGELCLESMFDLHLSVNYGYCLAFNPFMRNYTKVKDPVQASIEGRSGGLTMRFAIEEDEYIRVPQKVTTAGVKIGIFPFGKPPNIEEDGFNIMPGQSVDIQLRPLKLIRLPEPYPSGCQTDWSSTKYSYLEYEYDYKTCLRFCIGHQIAESCRCWDPLSNAHQIEYEGSGLPHPHWCNLSSPVTEEAICANNVRQRRTQSSSDPKKQFECPCKPACQVSSYSMQTSSAAFPARGFMEKYAQEASLHPFAVRQQWQSIKDSLLEVNVFFHSFDELKTEESPQYSVFSISSDLGGALGLLLGLCGFNLIEILVMIWDMLSDKLARRGQENKEKSAVEAFSAPRTIAVNPGANKMDPFVHQLRTEMFLRRKLDQ